MIEGHSDKSGDETANLIVGERRAESVRNFLVKMGVDGKRLITVSYGEEHLSISQILVIPKRVRLKTDG